MHKPLSQSLSFKQIMPRAHCSVQEPPQSVSVSSPFATPSLHVGPAHAPSRQLLDRHSSPTAQASPTSRSGHPVPAHDLDATVEKLTDKPELSYCAPKDVYTVTRYVVLAARPSTDILVLVVWD
eukprot:scaffold845_cov364-Prasinococcus_capsulatus_cf.AAC.6